MPLILTVMGGISLVIGVLAIIMRFVDQTGFDFSLAFAYQALAGGVLLIAFGKLLKHVEDTDANTARLAQAMLLGGGARMASSDDVAAHDSMQTAAAAPAPVVHEEPETSLSASVGTEEENEPALTISDAPNELPEPEPEPAQAEPVMQEVESVSEPVEQIEVRGYMVDVFANGTVDVHTAEGAMRFESLAAFERELDRAAG